MGEVGKIKVINGCSNTGSIGSIKSVIFVQRKYNYHKKMQKAMIEGNVKYMQSVFNRGKAQVISGDDLEYFLNQ